MLYLDLVGRIRGSRLIPIPYDKAHQESKAETYESETDFAIDSAEQCKQEGYIRQKHIENWYDLERGE